MKRYFITLLVIFALSVSLMAQFPPIERTDTILLHETITELFLIDPIKCSMDAEDIDLFAFYVEQNVRYFDMTLPTRVCIQWQPALETVNMLGLTSRRGDWYFIEVSHKLKQSRGADGRWWRFVLLHEMAHLPCYDEAEQHGKCWKDKMKEFAALGCYDNVW